MTFKFLAVGTSATGIGIMRALLAEAHEVPEFVGRLRERLSEGG